MSPVKTAAAMAVLFVLASTGAAQDQAPTKGRPLPQGRVRPQQPQEVGLIENSPGAFGGYVLLAPLFCKTTFLIDSRGRIVRTWESEYSPGQSAYLLESGRLLRTATSNPGGNGTFHGGGSGGRVQEYSWDGELLWDFEYSSEEHLLHHDIERLPGGNILMIAWERKSRDEAFAAGRNPEKLGREGLWPDTIIEVKPTGRTTGEIVWRWSVWDHLIQDRDPEKANFGDLAAHPELVNINPTDWTEELTDDERDRLRALGYLGGGGGSKGRNPKDVNADWCHTNSIAYNAELDQIVLSVLGFNEIWIIDHGTTTEEAAGHTGGRSGRGGDLLYRWGNPMVYGRGTPEDQRLFAQHDAQWIPAGLNGAGHLLVFNNGRGRLGQDYSSVDEVVPPLGEDGLYAIDGEGAYGPAEAAWSYCSDPREEFSSLHISGAQRLANGNTLICSGETGILFEVTEEKDVVWQYVNPVFGFPGGGPGGRAPRPGMGRNPGDRRGGRPGMGRRPMQGGPGGMTTPNCVFRAYAYASGFAGLEGRKLEPGQSVEEWYAAQPKTAGDPRRDGGAPGAPGSDEGGTESKAGGTDREAVGTDREAVGFVIKDLDRFLEIVSEDAKVQKLAGSMRFVEGPVWIEDGAYLLFSDIPANEIKKWQGGELSTFRKPSNETNGNTLDEKGRLLSCEHQSRSVTRTGKDGKVETLADSCGGKRFNSPNDICVRPDGTIWFTDPPYGLKGRKKDFETNNVFRLRPETGEVTIAASDFERPNGICLSPDGKKLYIADSGRSQQIRVFEVREDGSIQGGRTFCTIDTGGPDGIRCDGAGRLFSSAGDGVHIFAPDGSLIGKILVPETPANLCFGGLDGRTLFITARMSLYAIRLKGTSRD